MKRVVRLSKASFVPFLTQEKPLRRACQRCDIYPTIQHIFEATYFQKYNRQQSNFFVGKTCLPHKHLYQIAAFYLFSKRIFYACENGHFCVFIIILYYSSWQILSFHLSRKLYIRILFKPIVLMVKFNEESNKKGCETLQSFVCPLFNTKKPPRRACQRCDIYICIT